MYIDLSFTVIPAQAGIQYVGLTALNIKQVMHCLDSRLRGKDGNQGGRA